MCCSSSSTPGLHAAAHRTPPPDCGSGERRAPAGTCHSAVAPGAGGCHGAAGSMLTLHVSVRSRLAAAMRNGAAAVGSPVRVRRLRQAEPGQAADAGPRLSPRPWAGAGDWNEALRETVSVLQCGRVVAVPTDTIYGIACLAQNSKAIRRIYDIKGRNADKPLAISVGNVEDIYKCCKVTVSDQLLRDLLPGPVTLVFKRSEELNKDLNPFTDLVGVRIPRHSFMQKLAQLCGEPLALTSANVSSQNSTLTPEEFKDLWPLLDLVVDGGPIGDTMSPECRLGSTVVNLATPGKYSIIRPGCAFTTTVEILQREHGMSAEC